MSLNSASIAKVGSLIKDFIPLFTERETEASLFLFSFAFSLRETHWEVIKMIGMLVMRIQERIIS